MATKYVECGECFGTGEVISGGVRYGGICNLCLGDGGYEKELPVATPRPEASDAPDIVERLTLNAVVCLAGEGWRPKVKPLVWTEADGSYTAQSALGKVYVDRDGDGFHAIENGRIHSDFATVEAAQAFVQANHNRWVGDWLDLPAPSVEEKLP